MAPRREQKITCQQMRGTGVRGLLIYCADYRCNRSTAVSATDGPMKSGFLISSRCSSVRRAAREAQTCGRFLTGTDSSRAQPWAIADAPSRFGMPCHIPYPRPLPETEETPLSLGRSEGLGAWRNASVARVSTPSARRNLEPRELKHKIEILPGCSTCQMKRRTHTSLESLLAAATGESESSSGTNRISAFWTILGRRIDRRTALSSLKPRDKECGRISHYGQGAPSC
jgi:hypothetical protein